MKKLLSLFVLIASALTIWADDCTTPQSVVNIAIARTVNDKITFALSEAGLGTITYQGNAVQGTSMAMQRGAQYQVKATPAAGCKFVKWTDASGDVSTDTVINYVSSQSTTLTAVFYAYPAGAIPSRKALFSVCDGYYAQASDRRAHEYQVYFAQGNLQCKRDENIWKFAETQYEILNVAPADNVLTDYFHYGSSKSAAYVAADIYQTENDWGAHAISNGGNVAGQWYTLTPTQWKHLVWYRENADDKVGLATVNGVYGLLILPDEWTLPENHTFIRANHYSGEGKSGYYGSYNNNVYYSVGQIGHTTANDWEAMEANGALFLPNAGFYYNSEKYFSETEGSVYWTGKYDNTDSSYAYGTSFEYKNNTAVTINPGVREGSALKASVRLVQKKEE